MRRAVTAGTGDAKKNQAWAPFPDRERSTWTESPATLHASRKAPVSAIQLALSKSAAMNQQVSSRRRG
jgi:hypothetical protein